MSTSSARFDHEVRTTANLQSLSPKEEFEACDSFLRSYEQQVTNWPAVAQACLRVKQGELWKHGGYHSWHDWINQAAPVSARTVFYHTGLFENLLTDFTVEELAGMLPETAKALKGLSTSVRRDPRVRKAANGKKRDFIATVKETHPEQLIEDYSMLAFSLSDTQRSIVDEEFDYWRKQDAEISDSEILVALCLAAGEIRKSERSV